MIQHGFEDDDHNIKRSGNASNIVVLICVITWKHVRVSVLDQGASLLLGSPRVMLPPRMMLPTTPLRTALVKQGSPLMVSFSLRSHCPILGLDST